jgi:hypothetical protein
MVKLHPRSLRLRHLVAPLFVASILISALVGFWWRPAWLALLAVVVPYALLSLVCAAQLASKARDLRLTPIISFTFLLIHAAWGSSFLLGLLRSPRQRIETTG